MTHESTIEPNESLIQEAKRYIHIPPNPPRIILIDGPCRSGTTALSNLFAHAGIPSFMQPIKSILRAIEAGEIIPTFQVPQQPTFIVSKETMGSSTPAEFFNPVKILLELSYPPSQLHLVTIMRHPTTTAASWARMWDQVDPAKIILAYRTSMATRQTALSRGISTTAYIPEILDFHSPELVATKVFTATNALDHIDPHRLVDWTNGPRFGEPGSNIIFFDAPPEKFIDGIKYGVGYRRQPSPSTPAEADPQLALAYQLYIQIAAQCHIDLGLA